MTNEENFFFTERWSEDLESDRKLDLLGIFRVSISARNCEARQSSEARWRREDIRKVHLEGIGDSITELPGDRWCGRCDDDIDLFEGIFEVFLDEFSHEIGTLVVGVIEFTREHEGAEHDTSLSFFSEGCTSIRGDIIPVFRDTSIADPVISSEIRRYFSWHDDVVDRETVLRMRKADRYEFSTELSEFL